MFVMQNFNCSDVMLFYITDEHIDTRLKVNIGDCSCSLSAAKLVTQDTDLFLWSVTVFINFC